ncbi:MAG: hypothetical protein NXI22_02250 [bacterium]|nr:hypothetical protein [bacterium]
MMPFLERENTEIKKNVFNGAQFVSALAATISIQQPKQDANPPPPDSLPLVGGTETFYDAISKFTIPSVGGRVTTHAFLRKRPLRTIAAADLAGRIRPRRRGSLSFREFFNQI